MRCAAACFHADIAHAFFFAAAARLMLPEFINIRQHIARLRDAASPPRQFEATFASACAAARQDRGRAERATAKHAVTATMRARKVVADITRYVHVYATPRSMPHASLRYCLSLRCHGSAMRTARGAADSHRRRRQQCHACAGSTDAMRCYGLC